ncbi:MAG: VacJ family lipoprotein [Sphingobacteriia bacterium]|nr:VacJ family lipoprotein [Sphingobacteriia bacterium]
MQKIIGSLTISLMLIAAPSSKAAGLPHSTYSIVTKLSNETPQDYKSDDVFNYYEGDEYGYNYHELKDPLEGFNRGIYAFNKTIDTVVLEPAARIYKTAVPLWGRDRVNSALNNLGEPVNLVNNVLQGKFEGAMTNLMRFLVNSTVGLFGLFDIASMKPDLQPAKASFNETLAHYCAEPGPYIVIPILGPSSGRGTIGLAFDAFADPFNYTYITNKDFVTARSLVRIVHNRHLHLKEVKDLRAIALDEYTMVKSVYSQKVVKNRCFKNN